MLDDLGKLRLFLCPRGPLGVLVVDTLIASGLVLSVKVFDVSLKFLELLLVLDLVCLLHPRDLGEQLVAVHRRRLTHRCELFAELPDRVLAAFHFHASVFFLLRVLAGQRLHVRRSVFLSVHRVVENRKLHDVVFDRGVEPVVEQPAQGLDDRSVVAHVGSGLEGGLVLLWVPGVAHGVDEGPSAEVQIFDIISGHVPAR
mmetsp:Transcript_0/g.2  ORF Transcript_0/g.2 Transcript_0/m.2 type:complete len:200 (-) Transcript_0:252-851(-)